MSILTRLSAPLPKIKFLLLAMIGAYLSLNLLHFALAPLIDHWSGLAASAVVVPPMVLSMVYLVIPVAKKL